MDPKLLHQLATIVKYGSMSRAAERLFVTQPTLTRAVKIIENKVGGPVLRRTPSGVIPTEIGNRLAQIGARIADYSNRSDALINNWKLGLGQEIRLGVGPLVAIGTLGDFIRNAFETSKTQYHFVTATASTLLEHLNDDKLDLVLSPVNTDINQENLSRTTVLQDQLAIYVGRKSKYFGCQTTIDFSEIKNEPWLGSGISSGIFEQSEISDLIPTPKLSFTGSIDLVISLLDTSNAIVSLPDKLIQLSGRLDMRHKLSVSVKLPKRDLALWQHKRSLDNPDVLNEVESLKQYFSYLSRTLDLPD